MDPVLRCASKDARFAFIEAEQDRFGVSKLCNHLGVSRAGFYAWLQRTPSKHDLDDEIVLEKVRTVFTESKKTYGSPRVHRRLRALDVRVGCKRVARLMRRDVLKARVDIVHPRSRWVGTAKFYCRTPNRIFKLTTSAPNQILVGDITYLMYGTTQVYLAGVLDRHTRRILGWELGHRKDLALTLKALETALHTQPPSPATIFHSDRGTEYNAYGYTDRLELAGVTPSTNRPCKVTDNAFMESFWHSLKSECYHGVKFKSEEHLRTVLNDFFHDYNNVRIHSALDYRTPIEYEKNFTK
jgi:transposase InsO family protein